jgi:hypothetical protein
MPREKIRNQEALIAGNGAEAAVKKIIAMIVYAAMIFLVALILLPLLMAFKIR